MLKKFIEIKKITKEQRKIILVGSIIVAFLFSFWLFVYSPKNNKLNLIKNELMLTEAQVAEINSLLVGKDLAELVKELNSQFSNIASLLPTKEEEIMDSLSKEASRLGVEVKNITPANKQLLENKVTGYAIEELPISMSIVCEFKNLGNYLIVLRNSFPALIRIRQIDIKKQAEGQALLNINLQLLAYLSKTK